MKIAGTVLIREVECTSGGCSGRRNEVPGIGIPPEQAQFLETRKFQINEIARVFRVPPHMVGDLEESSFSNIEQLSLEFVKYTLDPWVIRWEQALQQSLILPSEKADVFIKFNLDGLLRGDYQSRYAGYATGDRKADVSQ